MPKGHSQGQTSSNKPIFPNPSQTLSVTEDQVCKHEPMDVTLIQTTTALLNKIITL